MQLSKSMRQQIRSLRQAKFRNQHRLFIAEGIKTVNDLIRHGFTLRYLVTNDDEKIDEIVCPVQGKHYLANRKVMKSISALTTPPGLLAVFELPEILISEKPVSLQWSLVLDGIKDPGNMGTLLRTAHWFGIKKVYLINHCVDIFAPKTVQSSMGSIGAVTIETIPDLTGWIQQAKHFNYPLYATSLSGEPLKNFITIQPGAVIMGSESHGIDALWAKNISLNFFIPALSISPPDSLNVAVAAGIMLHYLCSRSLISDFQVEIK